MAINIPYPVIDMKKTGENIKKIREEHGLTVAEVQQFLGIENPQAIYQWQRGVNLPTVDHLCALSHLFDVSMNDIIVLVDTVEGKNAGTAKAANRIPFTTKSMILLAVA